MQPRPVPATAVALRRPVVRLVGENPAHSAARIFLVPVIAWDQMNVQVGHGLSRCGAIVDANVVACGMQVTIELGFSAINQRQQALPLSRIEFKK